jgi:hypothetical protein
MKLMDRLKKGACLCSIAALALALGGWDDNCGCERTEFVTSGVGDAVQVNKDIQMITPWPPYVSNRNLELDGRRASLAMWRYRHNAVIPPSPLNAQMAREHANGSAPAQPAPAQPGNE